MTCLRMRKRVMIDSLRSSVLGLDPLHHKDKDKEKAAAMILSQLVTLSECFDNIGFEKSAYITLAAAEVLIAEAKKKSPAVKKEEKDYKKKTDKKPAKEDKKPAKEDKEAKEDKKDGKKLPPWLINKDDKKDEKK